MKKYPKLLLALFACCLVSVVSQVNAGQCPDGSQSPQCQYPGYGPDWDARYSTGCSMTDNETGAVSFEFHHGSLDYVQSGMLMVAFQNAMMEIYGDWRDALHADPSADNRLIDWVGALEADLKARESE